MPFVIHKKYRKIKLTKKGISLIHWSLKSTSLVSAKLAGDQAAVYYSSIFLEEIY